MTSGKTSRLSGFYNRSIGERRDALLQAHPGMDGELDGLFGPAALTPEQANHMIENVVGVLGLPIGIAANFVVNGREVLVPMAVEEPSVVAGASFMAKLARSSGGFQAESDPPDMIGQIQLLDLDNLDQAARAIEQHADRILEIADQVDPVIKRLGGGARQLQVRTLRETPAGGMLVVHLIYDTRDAMGANAVNTAAEKITPLLEEISGGRAHLRILSNLADRRLARASCRIPAAALAFGDFSGDSVRDGIIEAWAFAAADPYRAATHNKGIMNGIDAVVIATGNDWRAIEAGAHAYAAREGTYTSLSRWSRAPGGDLLGALELPLAVGIVGGATGVNPAAKASLALIGAKTARELAEIIASVGLAQNLAALRALATEGIQRGHMQLHARQVAIAAGAEGEQIKAVAEQLVAEGEIRLDRAEAILARASG